MKRRQFLQKSVLAGTAGVTALTLASPALSQNRIKWRMQATWARNSPLLWTGPQLVADYISRASDGRLTIELYGAGDIAPPLQVLDAVIDGGLEMGHGYPAYWAGKLPAVQLLTPVPFGIDFPFGG